MDIDSNTNGAVNWTFSNLWKAPLCDREAVALAFKLVLGCALWLHLRSLFSYLVAMVLLDISPLLLHIAYSFCYREVPVQMKLPECPIMFIKAEKKKLKGYSLSQLSEEHISCD